MTRPEALAALLALATGLTLGANALHGKQLTRDDKRHAIILALKTWPDKSLNMIADQIGCARSYVHRVGDEVSPRGHVEKVTGKDGKSYPASRSNADKRRCVEIALREFPKLSSRAVAKMCGVGHQLVEAARPAQVDESSTSERTGQDGKQYPARRVVPEPQEPGNDETVIERGCA